MSALPNAHDQIKHIPLNFIQTLRSFQRKQRKQKHEHFVVIVSIFRFRIQKCVNDSILLFILPTNGLHLSKFMQLIVT